MFTFEALIVVVITHMDDRAAPKERWAWYNRAVTAVAVTKAM